MDESDALTTGAVVGLNDEGIGKLGLYLGAVDVIEEHEGTRHANVGGRQAVIGGDLRAGDVLLVQVNDALRTTGEQQVLDHAGVGVAGPHPKRVGKLELLPHAVEGGLALSRLNLQGGIVHNDQLIGTLVLLKKLCAVLPHVAVYVRDQAPNPHC